MPSHPLSIPVIALSTLEEILYRENSVIASDDVAILLATIYQEIGVEVPERILQEAESTNRE